MPIAAVQDSIAVIQGVGNQLCELQPAEFAAAVTGEMTPSADFTVQYGGQMLSFWKGRPFVPDAPLRAFLVAMHAPVA